MHYVYFILLDRKQIYKGYTSDLKRRWLEHESGRVKSTKIYQKKILVGYEAYILKSDALRREKFLKTTEGRRLFNQQYRDIINQKSI